MIVFLSDIMHPAFRKAGPVSMFLTAVLAAAVSCEPVRVEEQDNRIPAVQSEVIGFYLLNEGTMGANNATLDYADLRNGEYISGFFSKQNPDMPLSLGDVGNDILLAGDCLAIALHGSGIVEIADARTAEHLAEIPVPGCRYLAEDGGSLYVTSYAEGGSLWKISLEDYSIVSKIGTGHDPEQLHIHDGFIYVLNSGGMQLDSGTGQTAYEHTVTVVDMSDFSVARTDDVGFRNLYKVLCGGDYEYMTSRGDYMDESGAVFTYDRTSGEAVKIASVAVSNWCEYGGTVYTQATVYDENWNQTVSLGRLCGKDYIEDDFADLSSAGIKACYGLDVNPATGDFVLTDAGDYVTPGAVHYFSADGSLLWSHRAGVCPSRIVWIYED